MQNDELTIWPETINTPRIAKVRFTISDGEEFTTTKKVASHIAENYIGIFNSGEIIFDDPDNLFQDEWIEIKQEIKVLTEGQEQEAIYTCLDEEH
ncbi:MAG: hypothetical protein ACOYMB_02285 [Patescibacteria group bacterium]